MELGPYAAEIGLTPESLQSGTLTPPDKVKVGLVFEILKYAKRLNVSCLQSARWILSLYRDVSSEHDSAERRRLLDYVRRSASRKYSRREKIRGQKRKEFLDSQFELPSSLPAERENQYPSTEEDCSPSKGKVDNNTIMAKIKGPYSLRRSNQSSLELMMECEEDDLSPWQIEASRRALDDYEKAVQRIKAAKARQMIQQKASPVTTPASLPRSKSPDVIIVGETPATRTPTQIQQSRMGSTQHLKSQLHANQLQRSSLSNSMLTANTLNKSLAGNLSLAKVQGQIRKSGENSSVSSLSQQHSLILPKAISSLLSAANHRQVGGSGNNSSSSSTLGQTDQMATTANAISYGFTKTDPLDIATTPFKRAADTDSTPSPSRKKIQRKTSSDSSAGNWVPLDEYYYGKMEGDPNYWEEKGEHRFKCWYCSKMLYNNVRTMMHMQGHIDSEKQQNLDLSDLTQCKHCYKQFDTPFEMQTHIEKVHMNNANVLLCRICEKDHDSRHALTNHMRQVHTACEMPYICQMCNFRSSMYSDAVDHFKKKHDSSPYILCLYCLKIFRVKFVSNGWGQTQMYYHHLLKHQSKTNSRKCPICKLTFFNSLEVKTHRKKDHQSNQKGVIGMNAKYTTPDQVMIKVPEPGVAPSKDKGVKSLNAPALTKVMDYHGMRLPDYMETYKCIECKANMNISGHFRKYIECSMCRFATSCSTAYATHMLGFHSGRLTNFSISIPTEEPMDEPMYCLCGFGSRLGNKIANHMVYCIKKTCYTQKPDVDWVEVDDVDDDSNCDDPCRRPGASILDVLGLVKKQTLLPGNSLRFQCPTLQSSPGAAPAKSSDSDTKPSTQKVEGDSNSSAATNESAGPKDSDQSQNAQKQEVPKDTQSTQTPIEAVAESDVDAEFSNWRKVCCEEFELEAENIEKLINRDIAEEWTAEEWAKLQKDCTTYGFWFAITDYIYSCEDYTFVKILPRIFENLFLDPPENISNFLSRIRRRLKRGGVDWIKETFLEPQLNLGPLCDKLGITVELLQKGESPNVPASQLSKALALELLYYKKRHPTMSYADLAAWIKLIFNFPSLPDQRDLHFQLEGIHRLKNKLRGHKTEVVKMLKELFEPVFTASDVDVEPDSATVEASCSISISTVPTGSDSNLTVPTTAREEEEEEEEEYFGDNQDSKSQVSSWDNPPEGFSDDSCSFPAVEKKGLESPGSAKDTTLHDDTDTSTLDQSRSQFDREDSIELHDTTVSEPDNKPAERQKSDKLSEDCKDSCDTAASLTTSQQNRKRNHSETDDTESSGTKQKSSTKHDPVAKRRCTQETESNSDIIKKKSNTSTAGPKSGKGLVSTGSVSGEEAKEPITDDRGVTESQSVAGITAVVKSSSDAPDSAKVSIGIGQKKEEEGEEGELKVAVGATKVTTPSKDEPRKEMTTEAVTKDRKTATGVISASGKTDKVKSPEVDEPKSKPDSAAEKLQNVSDKKLRAAGGGDGGDVDLSASRKGSEADSQKKEDVKTVPDKKEAELEAKVSHSTRQTSCKSTSSSKSEADRSERVEPSKELLAGESGKKSLQKAEPEKQSTVLKTKPNVKSVENIPVSKPGPKSKLPNSSGTVKPASSKVSTTTDDTSESVEDQSKDEETKSSSETCGDGKEESGKSLTSVVKSVPDKITKSLDSKASDNTLKVSLTKMSTELLAKLDTTKSDTTKSDTTKSDTTKSDTTKSDTTKLGATKSDTTKTGSDSTAAIKPPTVTDKSEPKTKSNKTLDIKADSAEDKTLSSKSKPRTETPKEVKVKPSVESLKEEKPNDSTRGDGVKDKTPSKLHETASKITTESRSLRNSSTTTAEGPKSKMMTTDPTDGKKIPSQPQEKLSVSRSRDESSKLGGSQKPTADKTADSKVEGISGERHDSNSLCKDSKKKHGEDEGLKEGSGSLKPSSASVSSVGGDKPSSDKKKEATKPKPQALAKKSESADDGEKKLEKAAGVPDSSAGHKKESTTKTVSKPALKESSLASISSKNTAADDNNDDDGGGDDDSIGPLKSANASVLKPAAQPTKEMSSKSMEERISKLPSRESVLTETGSVQDKKMSTKQNTSQAVIKDSSTSSEKSIIIKSTESTSKTSSESKSKPSLEPQTKSALESLTKSSLLSKSKLSEPNHKPLPETPAKSLSKSPTKTSSETPTKTSSETLTKTSSETPAKTSSETPAKTSSETPAKTSSETPAKTSSETPTKTSSETPTKTSSETPTKTSSDGPAKTTSGGPAKSSSETPAKSSLKVPTKTSLEVPAKTSSEASAKSLSKAPAKTSSEAPVKSSSKVPTKSSSEDAAKSPSENSAKSSSEISTKTPAKSSSEAPTKSLSEAPTKSSSEAPTKSSSEAPTKSSSETAAKSSSGAPTKSSSDVPTKSSSEASARTSSEVQAKSLSEAHSKTTMSAQVKPAVSSSSSTAVESDKPAAAAAKETEESGRSSSKQEKDVHLPKTQTTATTKVGGGTAAAPPPPQGIKKEGDNKVTVIKMASATSHSNVDCSSGKSSPKSVPHTTAEAKRDSSKLSDTSQSKSSSRAVVDEGRSSTKHEGHQTSVITPTKKVEIRGFSASTPSESPGTPEKTSSSSPSSSSSQQQQKKTSSSSHDDGRRESSSSHGYDSSRTTYQKSRHEMSREHSQHHRDHSMYDSDYRSQASDRLYHPRDEYGDRKYSSSYDNRNTHAQRGSPTSSSSSSQYGSPEYRSSNPGQYSGSRDYRAPKSYDHNRGSGGGSGGQQNRSFDPNWRNNRGSRGNYSGGSAYRGGYRGNYY